MTDFPHLTYSDLLTNPLDFWEHCPKPDKVVGIILGSGLSDAINTLPLDPVWRVPYSAIPGFPPPTVAGHPGQLVVGQLTHASGKTTRLVIFQGRFHAYEGHSLKIVTLPIQLLQALGASQVIITNAAGCLEENWHPGEIMAITDHLNLTGQNPLIGWPAKQASDRFIDLQSAYSPALRQYTYLAAKQLNLPLREGVYAGVLGPSFETPAEIRMFYTMGANAVGMSTVPEVILARYFGIEVLGLSLLTNYAAGLSGQPLTHQEVYDISHQSIGQFSALLRQLLV